MPNMLPVDPLNKKHVPSAGTWVTLNGWEAYWSSWEIEFDSNLVDATGFGDRGFADRLMTLNDAKFTIKGFWDLAKNPHLAPPNIRQGANIENVLFGLDFRQPNLFAYRFPLVVVDKVRVQAVVRDLLKLDFDGYNRGSFNANNNNDGWEYPSPV